MLEALIGLEISSSPVNRSSQLPEVLVSVLIVINSVFMMVSSMMLSVLLTMEVVALTSVSI